MESMKKEAFHLIHKVPVGNGPYVRAKHLQIVEKDYEAAIVWFWKAINAGDRVDSALKDMAVVMKHQDRTEEAIEAIHSLRHSCPKQAQESIDNLLVDLYKKCGRVEDQIQLLKQKLRAIYHGQAFNGKITKTARSRGKKFQVSIKQETARILGNLGWAYMQSKNYDAAEMVYQKAQRIEPDANKACNLGLCLIRKKRFDEAQRVLDDVVQRRFSGLCSEEGDKIVNRAAEMMKEIEERKREEDVGESEEFGMMLEMEEDEIMERLDVVMNEWAPFRSRRLPIFEEISPLRDQIAC